MLNKIFATRIITTIIVIITMVNAFAFVGIGVFLSAIGIIEIFTKGLESEARPGLKILGSLDMFLIGLVFLIFAIGISKLFHPDSDKLLSGSLPPWLNLHSFAELKLILWEAILTTLVVIFVSDVVRHGEKLDWTILLIPVSIILLSASIFVLRKSDSKKNAADGSD